MWGFDLEEFCRFTGTHLLIKSQTDFHKNTVTMKSISENEIGLETSKEVSLASNLRLTFFFLDILTIHV